MTKGQGLKRDIYEVEIYAVSNNKSIKYTVIFWRFHTYGIFCKTYENVKPATMAQLTEVLNSSAFSSDSKKWTVLTEFPAVNFIKIRYIRK